MNDVMADLFPEVERALETGAAAVEEARTRVALLHILEDLQEERRIAVEARRQWIETVDALRDPLMVHDAEFRVRRCNRAYARRAAMELREVIDKPYWECFPRGPGPAPACLEAVRTGQAFSEELIVLASGETFQLRCFAVKDSDPPQWLSVLEDETEERRARAALEMSERRFRSLIEGSNDVIYVVDGDGKVKYRSPAATRLFAREDSDVVGASSLRHFHPDDIPAARAAMQEVLREPQKTFQLTARVAGGSGQWLDVEVLGRNLLADSAVEGVILNVRDITERRRAGEKLRRSLERTIEAIAATVETRDPYTAGHQRRVADLAQAIGREMDLPGASLEGIRFGAMIHDLGKVQIPAEILAKPARLSRLEFELIKTHPQAGYEIIKDIEFPWPVAQMVLQHHERLDGSGYPQGLKGDEIALEARVLAVADVVEAVGSHRPYRPALGVEMALAEIEGKRGAWFDPQVVNACLRLFRDKGYSLSTV